MSNGLGFGTFKYMSNVEQTKTLFKIPSVNMSMLDAVLAKLNKRAKKLSAPLIETKVLGYSPAVYGVDGQLAVHAKYEVEVVGPAPKIPGWTFLGTIEHTENGNILRSLPGLEIPESYRNAPKTCDHCKAIRNRKDTYMVRADSGEIKQVGHNCIRDYLGHNSPEMLALAAEWVKEFEGMQEEREGSGTRAETHVEINDFMEVSAELILNEGYRNRTDSRGSTSATAFLNILSRHQFRLKKTPELIIQPSPRAIKLAAEAMGWGLSDEFSGSSYATNAKLILKMIALENRHTGLAASVIQAYLKFQGQTRAKETIVPSEFVGVVGSRVDFKLTLTKKLGFEGQYAMGYILLFKDAAGNVFKWSTTNGQDFYEGETYDLKATIKSHDVYKDIKQTAITRAKILVSKKSEEVRV